MTKPAKRHHFVPRLILKRFASVDGGLYFFNKKNAAEGVGKASPKKLFSENHLYSEIEDDGSRNPKLENELATFEGEIDQIIDKIVERVRRGKQPNLTPAEKHLWDEFTILQWKRIPQILEKYINVDAFDRTLENFIEEFEVDYRPLTEAEREDLDSPETRARILQNVKVDTIRSPMERSLSVLHEKGIGIAVVNNSKKSFVIGSSPIVKLNYPGRSSIVDPTTEVWFPISADVAITPALNRGVEVVANIHEKQIRYINACIYKQSDLVAGRSKELIQSLARRDIRQVK